MAGFTPQDIIDTIIDRTDIIGLISGYIPLKRAGRNFKATCPFHHEKTPSFMVSPERQIYHCFGCGAGGNAINFLMQYERLEFREALEVLAKKAGVSLPQYSKEDSGQSSNLRLKLYNVMELATNFYCNNLLKADSARVARDYLAKRNVKDETINNFQLGFAHDSRNAIIQHLRGKNISIDLIEKAGLIIHGETGFFDRFRNRVMFPIFDVKSRPIAFGARWLPDAKGEDSDDIAKYINSPETPIYIKGKTLFGLNLSKDAIKSEDFAIIVEGYFDFLLPYQEGQHNIVTSSGTALTTDQIRLLARYTNNVVIVYDADKAGELATLRSLDMLIEERINLKVASLATGFDPDSFVRKEGIEAFRNKCIKEAQNIFDYKLSILTNKYSPKDIEGKASIICEMLPTINKFKNEVLRSNYLKNLAQALDVSQESVLIEANKARAGNKYTFEKRAFITQTSAIRPVEKLVLRLMLEEAGCITKIRQNLELSDFQSEHIKKVVEVLFDHDSKGTSTTTNKLMNIFSDDTITSMLAELSSHICLVPLVEDRDKILEDCISRIKKEKSRLKRHHLHNEIKTAQETGDNERLNRLALEYNKIIKEGF